MTSICKRITFLCGRCYSLLCYSIWSYFIFWIFYAGELCLIFPLSCCAVKILPSFTTRTHPYSRFFHIQFIRQFLVCFLINISISIACIHSSIFFYQHRVAANEFNFCAIKRSFPHKCIHMWWPSSLKDIV